MKPVRLAAPAVLLAAATTFGCASTPTSQIDDAYVARVERAAKLGGAQLIWVNYPRKPVTLADAEPQKK